MAAQESRRTELRPWEEADAEALFLAFGDHVTMRFWDRPPYRDVAAVAEAIRDSRATDPAFHAAFAIVLRATGLPIGMINYHDRRIARRRLAVGWILAPEWQRKGLMREAATAFLDHCFNALDTHRIEARIEPANTPSVALALALGFQREGLMRDWMFVAGEPRSPELHALLRPDWRAQVSSTSSPYPVVSGAV
jgi:ribosomal-protein-alanine N-acetyltransferase